MDLYEISSKVEMFQQEGITEKMAAPKALPTVGRDGTR